jgi:hypothetical protein
MISARSGGAINRCASIAGSDTFAIFGMWLISERKSIDSILMNLNIQRDKLKAKFEKRNLMYSREETQKLKREFWVAFADKYPRKWLLYDTKIKDFSFKFFVDNTKAQVLIDIEHRNVDKRNAYFDKLYSLRNILQDEFVADLVFEREYFLDNGKTISRIWTQKDGVSVSKRSDWNAIFDFFDEKMSALEQFYAEYDDYIKDIELNS